MKSELGGKFEDVIVGLMLPPVDYMCKQLNKAMKGAGTDEQAIVEIVCSRNNREIKEIVDRYEQSKSFNLLANFKIVRIILLQFEIEFIFIRQHWNSKL